jgi:hypothetical protein
MRNEREANLALEPLPRVTWTEPSRLPRRRLSLLRRLLNFLGVWL